MSVKQLLEQLKNKTGNTITKTGLKLYIQNFCTGNTIFG